MTQTQSPDQSTNTNSHAGAPSAPIRTSLPTTERSRVFRQLNMGLPLNEFKLPDHIYRADLIPLDIQSKPYEERRDILEAASIFLTFEHGYPAIDETTPLWERLPAESLNAYNAFVVFLELPETTSNENPIRLLPHIATLTQISLETIVEWCHTYYWHWRARAHDLFLIACHRKQREQRIMSIEGKHFSMAEKALNKINTLVEMKLDRELRDMEDDPNAETETKLKDLVDMANKLVGIQRVSVGLPSTGPSTVNLQLDGPRHTTAADSFKHIAKEGSGEETTSQRPAEMDALLANPDDLSRVQELLIRVQAPDAQMPAWGSGTPIAIEHRNAPTDSDDPSDIVEDLGNPE